MESIILEIKNLHAGYGKKWVLHGINLKIPEKRIIAIMGPSGCGKSTLLRCINRMHELSEDSIIKGNIFLKQKSIFKINPFILRRQIGMVFQKPNPFPTMSIFDNVIAGYTLNGIKLSKEEKEAIVEENLRKVYLWNEVKDHLNKKGTFLSGGQQQRLCIARSLAMKPDILLLDEPTSALDPKATFMVEELIKELKKSITIIIVTHNLQQASRVADYTAFMFEGNLIEYGSTENILTKPSQKLTEEYSNYLSQ